MQLEALYYITDDFVKISIQSSQKKLITRKRNRKFKMADSEIISIIALYTTKGRLEINNCCFFKRLPVKL